MLVQVLALASTCGGMPLVPLRSRTQTAVSCTVLILSLFIKAERLQCQTPEHAGALSPALSCAYSSLHSLISQRPSIPFFIVCGSRAYLDEYLHTPTISPSFKKFLQSITNHANCPAPNFNYALICPFACGFFSSLVPLYCHIKFPQ